MHDENELCPKYKEQLKKHPEWVAEATDFATVAGQYHLITSQSLDHASQAVNKVVGTNLTYEGTHQFTRDIQVFQKLNSDSFSRCGYFRDAATAKDTLANSGDGFKRYLTARLNGTGQEVDWLREMNGKASSILNKASLPDGNTVGYDGIVKNRLTGNTIERVTIKAANSPKNINTNINDVMEALKKGTLKPTDQLLGIEGTKDAFNKTIEREIAKAQASGDTQYLKTLQQAKSGLKISESSTPEGIKKSSDRLMQKIENGKAATQVTFEDVASKMCQGAVVGAAVSLTVSGITSFIKYKNGTISKEEAFGKIGEDTVKGALIGGAMSGITIFLPVGVIGFAGGIAIGIYLNAAFKNILDEVFGKGAYEQILNSCGYVAGTCKNIEEMLREFENNIRAIDNSISEAKTTAQSTQKILSESDEYDKSFEKLLEGSKL